MNPSHRALQYIVLYCLLLLQSESNGFSISNQQQPIPITVISGFLGSGKTTLLQHLLNNNEGLKIAVIVNDVAEINIDNKLIAGNTASSSPSSSDDSDVKQKNKPPAGIVQLSNGCACCSIADELLPSVSQLIALSDRSIYDEEQKNGNDGTNSRHNGGGGFDHIVIELSGVASPKAIRANFQEAEYYGMPLMDRIRLDTMVTVVDCTTFLKYLQKDEGRRVNEEESPELYYRSEEERMRKKKELENGDDELENYWSTLEADDTAETATISQLIVEQTETSDVILLNKLDLVSENIEEQKEEESAVENIEAVVSSLNSKARIFQTKFGIVDRLGDILGAAKGMGVTDAGIGDDHREMIDAIEEKDSSHENNCDDPDHTTDHSDDHSHNHDHKAEKSNEHNHSHDHEHNHNHSQHDHSKECGHDHSHEHSHEHSHNHDHSPQEDAVCTDPNCTDESHSHTHTHSHTHSKTTNHGQIGTYIYRARKPFHPSRLTSLLKLMPIVRGLPPTPNSSSSSIDNNYDDKTRQVFQSIIRSKGFSWLAHSHIAAMYWSHAGSSFEIQCLGRWWATLERHHWPEDAVDDILRDFDNINHDDDSNLTVGDRRQEIVFIGQGLGNPQRQKIVQESLDSCLLTDDEYETYKQECTMEERLSCTFENPLEVQMMTY